MKSSAEAELDGLPLAGVRARSPLRPTAETGSRDSRSLEAPRASAEGDSERVGMAERRGIIRDWVDADGYAAVSRLSAALDVSSVTIRTDLNVLESLGAVRRVHGGAVGFRRRPGRHRPSVDGLLNVELHVGADLSGIRTRCDREAMEIGRT